LPSVQPGRFSGTKNRVKLEGDTLLKKFEVSKLPILLIFNGNKLLGKIEGYFETNQKEELQEKIRKLIG
jgi:thioredoxin-related protein